MHTELCDRLGIAAQFGYDGLLQQEKAAEQQGTFHFDASLVGL